MNLCANELVSTVSSSDIQDRWKEHPALVIGGMHRSGTSLAANLLLSAGVNIGKSLIGPHSSNPKGHFENRDFVFFHQRALQALGLLDDGFVERSQLPVSQQLAAEGEEVAKANAAGPIWGFKDPRTVLFLDFWERLLPAARFVFVYRSPWEVVSSLFRRGDANIIKNPELALSVWRTYMEAILLFVGSRREKCLLIHVGHFVDDPNDTVELIGRRFHLNLQIPAPDVVERSFMTTDKQLLFAERVVRDSFSDVFDLWLRVNELADKPARIAAGGAPDKQDGVVSDWLGMCRLTSENRRLERELKEQCQRASRHAADTDRHIAELQATIARLQQREADLLNSYSWRITGPLRKLRRILR